MIGRILGVVFGVIVVAGAAVLAFLLWPAGSVTLPPRPAGAPTGADLVKRGAYLAAAADCVACHTAPGGQPYAGGVAFPLPFGTIYSGNITPDPETGIGRWSDADFVRALRHGVDRDGENLYPAFPYAAYALMTTEDMLAVKAYLFSLAPVTAEKPANDLKFPFSERRFVRFWNLLYVPDGPYDADPHLTQDVVRGGYLVEALGHCGECHTPRTRFYGLDQSRKFAGDEAQAWRAWNISSDPRAGIGEWTREDIADYLQHGHAAERGVAAGTMAEAVENSTSRLTRDDLLAMAAYLKTVPAQSAGIAAPTRTAALAAASRTLPGPGVLDGDDRGRRVFQAACASCHGWNGEGVQNPLASLVGERSTADPSATNLLQAVLHGTALRTAEGGGFMPSFAAYSDADVAAVATFVLRHFGGVDAVVTADRVASERRQGGAGSGP